MSPTRRDFLKYTGAAGLLLASSDLVGELIAQSPKGNPLDVEVQGAGRHRARRSEAGRLQLRRHPLHAQRQQPASTRAAAATADAARRRVRRRRRRRRRRRTRRRRRRARGAGGRPRRGRLRRARHSQRRLGLRQQPDRHRRRDQAHHAHRDRSRQGERDREEGRRQARAGAGLHRVLVDADEEGPGARSRRRTSRRACRRSSTRRRRTRTSRSVTASVGITQRVALLRVERRLLHRAGDVRDHADLQRHGEGRRRHARRATSSASPKTGGWEVAEETEMLESAERIADRSGRDVAPPSRSAWG